MHESKQRRGFDDLESAIDRIDETEDGHLRDEPVNYTSRSFSEGKKVLLFRDPLTWIRACFKYRFVSLGKSGLPPVKTSLLSAAENAEAAGDCDDRGGRTLV